MKRTLFKLKIMVVLASLIYPSFAVPALASDFFPLDLWEEMTGWQQNKGRVNEKVIGADNEPMSINWGAVSEVHNTFPFDVGEKLNALGDRSWNDPHDYSVSIGRTRLNKSNPYWLPEEFTLGRASCITACAKRIQWD